MVKITRVLKRFSQLCKFSFGTGPLLILYIDNMRHFYTSATLVNTFCFIAMVQEQCKAYMILEKIAGCPSMMVRAICALQNFITSDALCITSATSFYGIYGKLTWDTIEMD